MRREIMCSAGHACAHAHVRDVLPFPHPLNGNDRECPACHGNLSINPAANRRVHILITCHGASKCTQTAAGRREIRELLLKHGIAEECLGPYGLGGDGPTATLPRPRREADPALLAAARRDAAYAKLAETSADISSPSILRMCMQRIKESDGDLAGDPAQLVPSGRGEFIALARRTGIPRIQASTLANRWFRKQVAGA
jgi:hypothetical protein